MLAATKILSVEFFHSLRTPEIIFPPKNTAIYFSKLRLVSTLTIAAKIPRAE
jgi:hypothetical protein